jgi:broad specificity phosphatase PhoE
MTLAFYISHPQVLIDPAIPVPRWTLSDVGFARLHALRDAAWVKRLSALHTSDETKAIHTAEVLAGLAGCSVATHENMGENDRSATGFLPPPEFERMADAFFASPNVSVRGWERAIDAQSRIVTAVERVLSVHDASKPIAFSGHGGVGTLLYCHLASEPIRRLRDQPAGGGNVHIFEIATRRPVCAWTPLESIQALLASAGRT